MPVACCRPPANSPTACWFLGWGPPNLVLCAACANGRSGVAAFVQFGCSLAPPATLVPLLAAGCLHCAGCPLERRRGIKRPAHQMRRRPFRVQLRARPPCARATAPVVRQQALRWGPCEGGAGNANRLGRLANFRRVPTTSAFPRLNLPRRLATAAAKTWKRRLGRPFAYLASLSGPAAAAAMPDGRQPSDQLASAEQHLDPSWVRASSGPDRIGPERQPAARCGRVGGRLLGLRRQAQQQQQPRHNNWHPPMARLARTTTTTAAAATLQSAKGSG